MQRGGTSWKKYYRYQDSRESCSWRLGTHLPADASVPRSPGVLTLGGSSFSSIHTPRAVLTSMATEDLLVHDGSDGQAVEAISEGLPQFDVVASLACPGGRRQLTRGPLCSTLSPGLQAFQDTLCVVQTQLGGENGRQKRKPNPRPLPLLPHCLPDRILKQPSPQEPEFHFWHDLKVGIHPQHKNRARSRQGLVHLGFCLTESSPNRHPKCLSIGCAGGECRQVRPCLRILAALQPAATG